MDSVMGWNLKNGYSQQHWFSAAVKYKLITLMENCNFHSHFDQAILIPRTVFLIIFVCQFYSPLFECKPTSGTTLSASVVPAHVWGTWHVNDHAWYWHTCSDDPFNTQKGKNACIAVRTEAIQIGCLFVGYCRIKSISEWHDGIKKKEVNEQIAIVKCILSLTKTYHDASISVRSISSRPSANL